jgi:hypothetical protein
MKFGHEGEGHRRTVVNGYHGGLLDPRAGARLRRNGSGWRLTLQRDEDGMKSGRKPLLGGGEKLK